MISPLTPVSLIVKLHWLEIGIESEVVVRGRRERTRKGVAGIAILEVWSKGVTFFQFCTLPASFFHRVGTGNLTLYLL
jgi:hypothetical protein